MNARKLGEECGREAARQATVSEPATWPTEPLPDDWAALAETVEDQAQRAPTVAESAAFAAGWAGGWNAERPRTCSGPLFCTWC